MKTKINGKYIDPMVPAIAYQLAHGARSVWAPVFNTQPPVPARADRCELANRWYALHLQQEQALVRFDRDVDRICARLEGSTNG